ncbi:S9 family peptidase [Niastella caeni]|uniref:S9 family peptidase n=1 Tax=Niastella caeni TaxID=2569763 RepID=A0A4S8HK83_9BACT|nr:prolyl oligopeptidase family serine peptidase [Niastella caeni]THU34739.1 S9 family peptidase [Niastella caeni]
MKLYFLTFTFLLFILNIFCQNYKQVVSKPPLDISAIKKWPKLESPAISNNGKYILYSIINQPVGKRTLVIQAVNNIWKREIVNATPILFTQNSQKLIFKSNDTLYILKLETNTLNFIPAINSFKWTRSHKGDWLSYQQMFQSNKLILWNLLTEKQQTFDSVFDYSFDNRGNVLLIETKRMQYNLSSISIQLVGLVDNKTYVIWNADTKSGVETKFTNVTFDNDGNQLAFIEQKQIDGQFTNAIWYYKRGMDKAVMRINKQSSGISPDMLIANSTLRFSENGRWMFFQLQKVHEKLIQDPNLVKVNVWSYKDVIIQTDQQKEANEKAYDAALNVQDNNIIKITQGEERIIKSRGDYVLIENSEVETKFWWDRTFNSNYLFSLKDGSKRFLVNGTKNIGYAFSFSPNEKFLVYFDQKLNKYFSYDLTTEKKYNISLSIPSELDNEYMRETEGLFFPVGIAGWFEKDRALLIYDNYDIWQVDPTSKMPPINITNGYGLKNHIKFRLVNEPELEGNVIKNNESLLLTAFNVQLKDNGFFQKTMGKGGNPELLTMGQFYYYVNFSQIPNGIPGVSTIAPIKANDSQTWIVERMAANEAPNYFLTQNFKSYTQITNLQPHKSYNWLTTELIDWKQLDETFSQGILYKPENFDPDKKYPIIFEYYDQRSFALNAYLQPELTSASINIPWFVSHGYLVFRPDFHFSIASTSGKTNGMNAYNTIVSCARFLANKPWVDSSRMAINGHSFGGGITNYLITHTQIFAAAAEAAGVSDGISSYLDGNYGDRQEGTEIGQGRRGTTPWQRPDLYETEVLRANQVTTPLLIMHNKADYAVPWIQGVEMFMALRRLGKKVWMLQYDDEGHVLSEKAAEDYTLRLTQFFDHYLKGYFPPKWMTEGISARLKGIVTGYELDKNGKKN